MNNLEKNKGLENNNESLKELNEIREKRQELIRDNKEKILEKESDRSEKIESARNEALDQAREKKKSSSEKKERAIERRGIISKKDKKASFDKTMKEIQSEMSPQSRAFSKFIHNPAVEKTSEVLGNTVARPNAILSGSIFAVVLTSLIYIVAQYYKYPLSGTESIAAFLCGWIFGILFDYLRAMISGKSS